MFFQDDRPVKDDLNVVSVKWGFGQVKTTPVLVHIFVLYISSSVWVLCTLCTPNVGWNILFHVFRPKKVKSKKKQENLN